MGGFPASVNEARVYEVEPTEKDAGSVVPVGARRTPKPQAFTVTLRAVAWGSSTDTAVFAVFPTMTISLFGVLKFALLGSAKVPELHAGNVLEGKVLASMDTPSTFNPTKLPLEGGLILTSPHDPTTFAVVRGTEPKDTDILVPGVPLKTTTVFVPSIALYTVALP